MSQAFTRGQLCSTLSFEVSTLKKCDVALLIIVENRLTQESGWFRSESQSTLNYNVHHRKILLDVTVFSRTDSNVANDTNFKL